jgi:hypothetical protein
VGPVVIFDKSALQALSMDESVWLDAFFSANIVPLFYVETLADLAKDLGADRSAEGLVGLLADKTPSDAYPNIHHRELLLAELAGNAIPTTGVTVIAHGEMRKQPEGKRGLHVGPSTEAKALARWREQDFSEVERSAARTWRAELAEHDASVMAEALGPILPDEKISNLEQLKGFLDSFCATQDPHVVTLALQILSIPDSSARAAIKRWESAGRPPLDEFAPYATHVFRVDLLFYLGAHRGFISSERASNRVDMAYLYYLPFTKVFVSGDKLHGRTAPLFMTSDQTFLSAETLKAALRELDGHYERLPDAVKERGVLAFASFPPADMDNAVTRAWDRYMRPDWREISRRGEGELAKPPDREAGRKTIAELEGELASARPIPEADAMGGDQEPDYHLIQRMVPARKGRWRMVPPDAEE